MKRLEVKEGLFIGQVERALNINKNQVKLLLELGKLEICCYEEVELNNGYKVNARKFSKESVDWLKNNEAELKLLLETRHAGAKSWKTYNNVADESLIVDLTGKQVCLTGTFSRKRSELEKLLLDKGVIVKKTVTKSLDYLIAGVDGGSKVDKAQKQNTPIIGQTALEDFLNIKLVEVIKNERNNNKCIQVTFDYGIPDGEELSEDEIIF